MPGCAATRIRFVAACAVVVLLSGAAADTSRAATYYVAPSPLGSDANPGSPAAPWQTLQKAGDVAAAGDTVTVLPGTYAGFRPRHSGTAQAPVRFLAQPGVVVNAPGAANSNSDNIWVRDVDYIVVDGFESTAAPRAGIAIQGEPDANATGIVIRNCFCHNNSRWGIFTGFARDLLLENNETSFSAIEHGIYVSNSGDRPTVRRNHSHHNNASGIQLNADPSQLFDPNDPMSDGIITGALLELNVIHDNGAAGGAAINLASVRDSLFRNNLLYSNHASGIAGWDDGDDPNYGTRDNRIIGNTIVQAASSRFAISLKNGSFNNVILNNILLNAGPRGSLDVDPSSQVGMQSDYNIVSNQFSNDDSFFTLAEWRSFGFDQHSILSTSAAVFAGANDYHLSSASPARDSGTTLPDLSSDLDGIARPQGAQFDIGAYEFSGTGPSPTPTVTAVPATATRTRTVTATSTRTATATRTPTTTATRTLTASATAVASNTPTAGPPPASRIDGTMRYYRGNQPVTGASVELSGTSAQTASSDASGHFEFSNVADGSWQITPRKSGNQANGVSALDASWVLQYIAGRRSFDTMQQLVCDVTANGSLTTLDATRILQFTVGSLSTFASGTACGSDWLFAPQPSNGGTPIQPTISDGLCQLGAIAYPQLIGDVSVQDFAAAVIGDCTGNWQAPAVALRHTRAPSVFVSRLRHLSRGRLRAVMIVRADEPLQAVEATLAIDPTKLALVHASPALAARQALVQSNEPTPGTVAVALAAPGPIAAGARVAIVLEFARLAPDASRSRIDVTHIALDE